MRNQTIRSVLSVANSIRTALYLLASFLVLYPVLSTPLIADDFLNPFSQTADGGSGLGNAVRYGWRGSTEGASFRIFGTTIGGVFNWLWLTLSAEFDVNMTVIYAITKFFIFVGSAAAVASVWYVASRAYGQRTAYWDAMVLTSLALFGSLQIHAIWSNDPVASYPLAGYAPTALGFSVLTLAIVAAKRVSWWWYCCGAIMSMLAVGYYEINIGAVLGAAIILVAGIWTGRGDRRNTRRAVVGGALFVALPAALVLFGRSVTIGNSASYGGTEVTLDKAARTFERGVLSSIPGAAWRLSERSGGGQVGLLPVAFALAALIALLIRFWLGRAQREAFIRPSTNKRLGLAAATVAVMTYALFAVALQAITSKVQNEMLGAGYVYTFYAMTSSAVALGVAVAVNAVVAEKRFRSWRSVVLLLAAAFMLTQFTVNWRLTTSMNESYVRNRTLIASFDRDADMPTRCRSLQQWTGIPWPGYYEKGMTDGLQAAYQYYFGEPFCAGFVSKG